MAESELDAAIQAAAFSAAEQKATASTLGLGTATKGLLATMKAHPFMSITTAVGIVIGAYRDQTEAIKNLNKETAQKYLNENEADIRTANKK